MNSSAGFVSSRAAPGLFGKASGPLPLYFLMAGTVSRTLSSSGGGFRDRGIELIAPKRVESDNLECVGKCGR